MADKNAKSRSRSSSDLQPPKRVAPQMGVYHAKALQAQTRLYETLDTLDDMERTHAEQLALNQKREGKMRQKMRAYADVARRAEEEAEDMRQAVLKLVDKVEKNNGYKSVRPSQIHLSSLIDPIEPRPSTSKRVSPAEAEQLLSYAASMIEATRRERDLERKSHQKTKEWAQSRIYTLEAQLARREADLARCVSQCHDRTVPEPVEEDPVPTYQETLQWTVSKNKSLEMEIQALNDKLAGMRLREETTPTRPNTDSSLVHQIHELGVLIDGLKGDREDWRKVLDAEKPSVADRLHAVEEECTRLRAADEEMQKRLEAMHHLEEVRDLELKQRIELLDSQVTGLLIKTPPTEATPTQEDYNHDDHTIRPQQQLFTLSPPPPRAPPLQPESDPLIVLDDPDPHSEGESSSSEMELATPLMPTRFMEPPALPLEVENLDFDSPNPVPQSPSLPPSPFQLEQAVPVISVQEATMM